MKKITQKLFNFIVRRIVMWNMEKTRLQYKRINPPYEDVFDWRERGDFVFGPGKNITLYNSTAIGGDVEVGRDTWIGPFVCLDGSGGLKIGEHCSISTGSQILSHDTVDWALSGGKQPYAKAPVEIGDYTFVGTGAVVVKGVTIGKHCVIGANAVVTQDVPDNAIAAGNPARIIGEVLIDNTGKVTKRYFKQ